MPVTVLAIADQVSPSLYDNFHRDQWADVDLILSCGDLPPDYLDFLCSSLDVPVLYVRGNHDTTYEPSRYEGCEDVHGRIVQCKGLRIAGFQGSHLYNYGPLQYSQAAMRRLVRRARVRAIWAGRPDIILTHAPPAGCHDGKDQCHRGFEAFNAAIDAWRPQFFVHGHTHAYEGWERISQIGSTTVINAYPYHLFQVDVPARARRPAPASAVSRSPSGFTTKD